MLTQLTRCHDMPNAYGEVRSIARRMSSISFEAFWFPPLLWLTLILTGLPITGYAATPCPPVLCNGDCGPEVQPTTCKVAPPAATAWLGIPDPSFGLTEQLSDGVAVSGQSACAGGVLSGTKDTPLFIIGGSYAACTISGSYVIADGIDVTGRLQLIGDHIAVRNSNIHDAGGVGSMVSAGSGSTDLVFYNNEIHHNGPIPSTKDSHGLSLGSNTDRVWILNNHIHHNSGDAIQFCHNCVGAGNGPGAVYIGNNVLHDDEENAIDLKEYKGPVIISENEIYGYVPGAFSGHGEAIRLNDEGAQGEVWIINNDIYDSNVAINPDSSKGTSYILGNEIHDVAGSGIGNDADFVINNTVYSIGGTAIAAGGIVENNLTNASEIVVDGSNHLVELVNGSSAIDASTEHSVYGLFQSQYGLDIRFDIRGTPRPLGGGWDAGAIEHQ